MLFEYRTEIAAVIISDSRRYLIYIFIVLHKHQLCLLNTLSCKVLKGSQIIALLEQPAKILR